MGQEKNSTENKKGKHLTYENRIRIETLYKEGYAALVIGKRLIKSKRTIERELARGMVELKNSDWTMRKEYSAVVGQRVHDENVSAKGPPLKIGKDHAFVKYIETSIKSGNSPYATLQSIENNGKLKFSTTISVKTLYNYIDAGLFLNISNKDLLVKKDKKKRNYHKIRTAITNTKGTSIADRPVEIDGREEMGHWEIDLVVGKQGTKPVILTLVERKSRKSLYVLVKNKTQNEVIKAIKRARKRVYGNFDDVFKSITADNGSEFLNSEGIKKAAKCGEVYYAHPYSSWERGSNENGNKILRRFVPKGMDLNKLTKAQLQQYEDWVNNYPRKIFGYKTANEMAA